MKMRIGKMAAKIDKRPCSIRYCVPTCRSIDNYGQGFCSGYMEKPLKRFPKNDVILCCWFIDGNTRHMFMTPREALQVASYLAESFVAWREFQDDLREEKK